MKRYEVFLSDRESLRVKATLITIKPDGALVFEGEASLCVALFAPGSWIGFMLLDETV